MVEGKLIQPLTLDCKAFRKRYSLLSNMTSYERANLKGLENKRMKWAAYRPLAREQLFDVVNDDIAITLLNPYASHAPKKSSKRGLMYSQFSITADVYRPTEIMAILRALGVYRLPEEDIVIRQSPDKKIRWCIGCKAFRPLELFEKDRHNPSGLSFCCTKCRKDLDRGIWRKAA